MECRIREFQNGREKRYYIKLKIKINNIYLNIATDLGIAIALKMELFEYRQYLIDNFNVKTIQINHINHVETKIIFKSNREVKKAIDWINSVYINKKLRGEL